MLYRLVAVGLPLEQTADNWAQISGLFLSQLRAKCFFLERPTARLVELAEELFSPPAASQYPQSLVLN